MKEFGYLEIAGGYFDAWAAQHEGAKAKEIGEQFAALGVTKPADQIIILKDVNSQDALRYLTEALPDGQGLPA